MRPQGYLHLCGQAKKDVVDTRRKTLKLKAPDYAIEPRTMERAKCP